MSEDTEEPSKVNAELLLTTGATIRVCEERSEIVNRTNGNESLFITLTDEKDQDISVLISHIVTVEWARDYKPMAF